MSAFSHVCVNVISTGKSFFFVVILIRFPVSASGRWTQKTTEYTGRAPVTKRPAVVPLKAPGSMVSSKLMPREMSSMVTKSLSMLVLATHSSIL